MANITNLLGYNNKRTGDNYLLAMYGNNIVDVSTGLNFGSNTYNITSSSSAEWTVFIDKIFTCRNSVQSWVFDGTKWEANDTHLAPKAKYIHSWKNRLYLGNCTIPNNIDDLGNMKFNLIATDHQGYSVVTKRLQFPSRVFYSDLPQYNSFLTWGLWYGAYVGQNGNQGSKIIMLDSRIPVKFIDANLKVGDPIFPVDYSLSDQLFSNKYFITKIENNWKIHIDKESNIWYGTQSMWAGSNWFDTSDDSSDEITGLGSMTDRLLVFQLFSLWYYTGSAVRKVKDTPGTSSNKSIINAGGYTYYFHGSDLDITGIWRYDGVQGIRVSRGIDPYIRGMNASNFASVVAWREGESLRWYIGNLSNTNYGISMTNAVATLHLPTGAWDVSPIDDVVTCATTWRPSGSGQQYTYTGTSDDEVLKMNSGNSHNGTPIRMNLETKIYYPNGSETVNEFTTVQVIGRQTKGIKMQYRLYNDPTGISQWESLGELSDDKTELTIPRIVNQASGIQYRLFDTGSLENDAYVEKISTFYTPLRRRVL